jgi:hypothetical protein
MCVIECSCGMVMSISALDPRNQCIRCGGIEFRMLNQSSRRSDRLRQSTLTQLNGDQSAQPPVTCIDPVTLTGSIAHGCLLPTVETSY